MFFWNSLAFPKIQWMLAIWSMVPLPFLNPAWASGSSLFMYCWSPAWRTLSITLLLCEMSAIMQYSLISRWWSIRMCTYFLWEVQNYNLLLNNHWQKYVGSHQKDIPHPRAKEKPQQDGRRGEIMFRIKPHTCQSCSEGSNKTCAHQETPQRLSQTCLWAFECLLQGYGSAVACRRGRGSGYRRPGYGISPLGGGRLNPTIEPPELTGLGKQTLGEHKQKLVLTRTQENGAVTPQGTDPDLPVSVQDSPTEAWVSSDLL